MATDHELRLRERLARLRNLNLLGGARVSGELEKLQRQLERIQAGPTDEEIWRSVELARHQDRPYTLDYVERLFDDWVELHGDRGRADDHALVIGLGRFDGRTVALGGSMQEHCSAFMYAVGHPAPVPAMRHRVKIRGHCVSDSRYNSEAVTVSTVPS